MYHAGGERTQEGGDERVEIASLARCGHHRDGTGRDPDHRVHSVAQGVQPWNLVQHQLRREDKQEEQDDPGRGEDVKWLSQLDDRRKAVGKCEHQKGKVGVEPTGRRETKPGQEGDDHGEVLFADDHSTGDARNRCGAVPMSIQFSRSNEPR